MASYQSGFDPPIRPDHAASRGKRLGTYIPPPISTSEDFMGGGGVVRREADIAHISGQMDQRQAPLRSYGRQTNIPLPNNRDPLPVIDRAAKPKATQGFGFRRQAAQSSATPGSLPLKTKQSRNVLRRKPSTIAQNAALVQQKSRQPERADYLLRNQDSWPIPQDNYSRPPPASLEPRRSLDDRVPTLPNVEGSPAGPPELVDRYRSVGNQQGPALNRFVTDIPHKLATHDLPPPTPQNSGMSGHSRHSGFSGNSGYSAYSASPSTRFSESPGPGAYSRDTTPTSMSSQSPGIAAPLRMTPRLRQTSPINSRPPVSSRRRAGSNSNPNEADAGILDAQGLPSLRESLTSSSSNSTVKGSEKTDKKKKKKRLSPLPPSPPPRKSSQKFKKPRGEEDEQSSPSKPSRAPASLVMTRAEDSPGKQSSSMKSPLASKPAPPRRPSREGTPDLTQLGESMNVIQSNLPGLHLSPDRRQSIGVLPRAGLQVTGKRTESSPRPNNVSRLPSRGYSPSPVQQFPVQVQREATPAPSGLGIIPDLRPAAAPRLVPGSRTPSPSTATPKHRFGLFGRRTKTTPEITTVDNGEKSTRRGPAAGTGHEGYGRYALKSRSQSTPGTRDRSHSAASSQESLASNRPHDPFLLERMSPVIIAGGGGIVSNRNESLELSRSESSQSVPHTRPSIESKTSTGSNLSKEATRTTLWPSAMPRNAAASRSSISLASKGTYLSESSDNENSVDKPTLAFRRSMHRLLSTDQEPLKLPKPITISSGLPSPGASSQGTSLISDDTTSTMAGKGKPSAPRKLSKRPRSPRKWNFFQRTQTASPKPQLDAVPVVITAERAPSRSVPYYAMMDSSEQEGDETLDMADILRDAEVVDFAGIHKDSPRSESQDGVFKSQPNYEIQSPSQMSLQASISSPQRLFSSPEPLAPEKTSLPTETTLSVIPPVRPSRLAQVGRIPRVVPARPEQTSPKSFSRPFARVSMIQPLPKLDTVDRQSIAVGPSPERSPSPPHRPTEASPQSEYCALGLDNSIIAPAQAVLLESDQTSYSQERAFLVISPRKNSEATSSSSGALSTTAVIPEPDAALEEDEVWDEYDDLIGNEEAMKVPVSATSSHGVPFQYEGFESRAMKRANEQKKESPVVNAAGTTFVMENGPRKPPRLELTSSSMYSPDLSAGFKKVFNSMPTPTTPMSFTDFFSGYGDRNNSVITGSGGTRRLSSHSLRDSRPISSHSKSASMSEASRKSIDSKLGTISEQPQDSPIAQVNLRVGSLTVSKWLTFGHVLFSPAREEILHSEDQSKHHSVLVVDGLGNDDFSYYACETHPTATFYNLSPTAAINGVPSKPENSSFPQPPNNHRQVQYTNNLDKFPFPRDTFAAVVLRFPSACSETAFRNLITESRRVLKPAGYLEMSILDLDMMNMGNRTRRAVRGLKVNISVADPSMSLASASDTALRMIGKRAFHDIKSCKVGVPVASTVTARTGSGSHSGSEGKSDDNDISLADMMKDETSVGDDGIAKMVAKVGRFWFLRCYEKSVLPNGDTSRSIFADASVLRECEKWNTSFKLLVCYAQKPAVPRRRTASV